MNTRIILSNRLAQLRPSCASALSLAFLVLATVVPARSQEPPKPTESIVDAARNARQRKSNSATPPVVFTNDDLAAQSAPPVAAAVPQEPAAAPTSAESAPKQSNAAAPQPSIAPVPPPATTDCHNPNEERLKSELQSAQDELDQLRRELSYNPQAISGPDVDMTNFKSGSSGLAFGSPPLQQSQPQSPARINEVILEQRIASLKEASRVACEPPKDAAVQRQIDSAENELKLLQREFDLNQSAYYSKPNYAQDTTGKAQLDAQQQQIESLKSEISRLKETMPPPKSNPPAQ
jgi:hypothetical protein